jgi:hypothetical protein
MGIYGTGFARLLQVSGSLTRGPQADRLQLPGDGARRSRWNRDELGLVRWTGTPRRGAAETGGGHESERASGRSAA